MNELQITRLESTDISTWDFSLLRAELKRGLDYYAGLVYTDESIKDAKNDRTTLNKVKKVIEDARKAYKLRCLAPYDNLEPEIRELVDMVEYQRSMIDDTIKDYESRKKEAKELEIRKYYDQNAAVLGKHAEALYPKLFDKKWLNASTSRSKYEEAIINAVSDAYKDIETIRSRKSPFEDTLIGLYADTLSMRAVDEKEAELSRAAASAGLMTQEEAKTAAVINRTDRTDYTLLIRQVEELLKTEPHYVSAMSNISAVIKSNLSDINWAGFYLMRNNRLVVGPFQGKPACIHIEIGRGVCGSSVQQNKTLVVPDVHDFPGHIACDSASNSEIVIPIHRGGEVIAVLDIDSPLTGRFSDEDRSGLEGVVEVMEGLMEW